MLRIIATLEIPGVLGSLHCRCIAYSGRIEVGAEEGSALAIRSFRITSARDIESARQFLNDPTFAAAQIGMRIARTSGSASAAVRDVNSFLTVVVDEVDLAFPQLQQGRQQDKQDRVSEINRSIAQISGTVSRARRQLKAFRHAVNRVFAVFTGGHISGPLTRNLLVR